MTGRGGCVSTVVLARESRVLFSTLRAIELATLPNITERYQTVLDVNYQIITWRQIHL